MLGTFTKQPVDRLDYDLDYGQWLSAGDNLESVIVEATPTGSLNVEQVFIADPKVKVWLSGGVSGTTYKITITTTTADTRVRQDEFKLRVKEV